MCASRQVETSKSSTFINSLGAKLWSLITFAIFIRFHPDWNHKPETSIRFRNFGRDTKRIKTDHNRYLLCRWTESTAEWIDHLAFHESIQERVRCLKLNFFIHLCDVRTTHKMKNTSVHRMIVMWNSDISHHTNPKSQTIQKVDFFIWIGQVANRVTPNNKLFSIQLYFLTIQFHFLLNFFNIGIGKCQLTQFSLLEILGKVLVRYTSVRF